jgi:6-phosphogluconolactonase (cycloisomerase 2 family)
LPVIPPGASNSSLGAGELLLSPTNTQYTSQYLYATNRNDPNPAGDAIAIFAVTPQLRLVKHVRTGLKHIRAAAIAGVDGEYLVAGGMNGGGIVVYKRTNGGEDLTELARYTDSVVSPASFVFF